jgi:hypothetical protein
MTLLRATVSAVPAMLMFVSCSGDDRTTADEPATTVLADAHGVCAEDLADFLAEGDLADETSPGEWLKLTDDGTTLMVENPMEGEIAALVSGWVAGCVLRETDAPESVSQEIEQTSTLKARQEASWESVEMSYSFDPDAGLRAVLKQG